MTKTIGVSENLFYGFTPGGIFASHTRSKSCLKNHLSDRVSCCRNPQLIVIGTSVSVREHEAGHGR